MLLSKASWNLSFIGLIKDLRIFILFISIFWLNLSYCKLYLILLILFSFDSECKLYGIFFAGSRIREISTKKIAILRGVRRKDGKHFRSNPPPIYEMGKLYYTKWPFKLSEKKNYKNKFIKKKKIFHSKTRCYPTIKITQSNQKIFFNLVINLFILKPINRFWWNRLRKIVLEFQKKNYFIIIFNNIIQLIFCCVLGLLKI